MSVLQTMLQVPVNQNGLPHAAAFLSHSLVLQGGTHDIWHRSRTDPSPTNLEHNVGYEGCQPGGLVVGRCLGKQQSTETKLECKIASSIDSAT